MKNLSLVKARMHFGKQSNQQQALIQIKWILSRKHNNLFSFTDLKFVGPPLNQEHIPNPITVHQHLSQIPSSSSKFHNRLSTRCHILPSDHLGSTLAQQAKFLHVPNNGRLLCNMLLLVWHLPVIQSTIRNHFPIAQWALHCQNGEFPPPIDLPTHPFVASTGDQIRLAHGHGCCRVHRSDLTKHPNSSSVSLYTAARFSADVMPRPASAPPELMPLE